MVIEPTYEQIDTLDFNDNRRGAEAAPGHLDCQATDSAQAQSQGELKLLKQGPLHMDILKVDVATPHLKVRITSGSLLQA
jgi:hypothetical protein